MRAKAMRWQRLTAARWRSDGTGSLASQNFEAFCSLSETLRFKRLLRLLVSLLDASSVAQLPLTPPLAAQIRCELLE